MPGDSIVYFLGTFGEDGTNYPVTHDLFPSGPWTAFYSYSPKDKHRMDLDLAFTAGMCQNRVETEFAKRSSPRHL